MNSQPGKVPETSDGDIWVHILVSLEPLEFRETFGSVWMPHLLQVEPEAFPHLEAVLQLHERMTSSLQICVLLSQPSDQSL